MPGRKDRVPRTCEVTAQLAVDLGTRRQVTPLASRGPRGTTQGPSLCSVETPLLDETELLILGGFLGEQAVSEAPAGLVRPLTVPAEL